MSNQTPELLEQSSSTASENSSPEKLRSQCFLIYHVDLPKSTTGDVVQNPKDAILYLPYNSEEVPIIPKDLLSNVECRVDFSQWEESPKFVLNSNYTEVSLLHPNSNFSHIMLPGAQQSQQTESTDTQGRPLPVEYKRRNSTGKMQCFSFRYLDVYFLTIGSWSVLNTTNEARLKICPLTKHLCYEIFTDMPTKDKVYKTNYTIKVSFSSIVSITMLDKWQLLLKLNTQPGLFRSGYKIKRKRKSDNKKLSVTSKQSERKIDLEETDFTKGQLKTCLVHKLMLTKSYSSRVMDYLQDLRTCDLQHVQFLEQLQVFHEPFPTSSFLSEDMCPEEEETANGWCSKSSTTKTTTQSAVIISEISNSDLNCQPLNVGSEPSLENTEMSNASMNMFEDFPPQDIPHNFSTYGSSTGLEETQAMEFLSIPAVITNTDANQEFTDRENDGKHKSIGEEQSLSCACDDYCKSNNCVCVSNYSTCSFDCSCSACENPLNILKVVHKIPIDRLQRDRCLIYNITKSPSTKLSILKENKAFKTPCCQKLIHVLDILTEGSVLCACGDGALPSRFEFSWCLECLVPETMKNHCEICDICRYSTVIHCMKCNKCYDAGPIKTQPCVTCMSESGTQNLLVDMSSSAFHSMISPLPPNPNPPGQLLNNEHNSSGTTAPSEPLSFDQFQTTSSNYAPSSQFNFHHLWTTLANQQLSEPIIPTTDEKLATNDDKDGVGSSTDKLNRSEDNVKLEK